MAVSGFLRTRRWVSLRRVLPKPFCVSESLIGRDKNSLLATIAADDWLEAPEALEQTLIMGEMTDYAGQAVRKSRLARLVSRRFLFLWFGLGLLGVALWLTWSARQRREPVYEGRSISYWIAPHPSGNSYSKWCCPQALFTDSNAPPFLSTALDRQDSPLRWAYSGLYSVLPASIKKRVSPPVDVTQRRLYVAALLADMGTLGKPAIPALIRALHANDPELRRAAIRSLGRVGQGDPTAISALKTALTNAPVAMEAAESLWRLGQTDGAALAPLVAALENTNSLHRCQAALVLGSLEKPSPEAVAALTAASQDADADLRLAAALALRSHAGAENHLPSRVLTEALKDRDPQGRIRVARCIAESAPRADPVVIAALRVTLDDGDSTVRVEAAIALVQLGQWDTHITQTLISGLQNSSSSVRFRAARALGQLNRPDKDTIRALSDALHDSFMPQLGAAVSLWRLGETNRGIFRALAGPLNDREPGRRVYSLNALGTLGQGEPTTRAALREALKEEDPAARSAATNALRYLGSAVSSGGKG